MNWVLDADIRGFFDSLNHEWLVRFLEHRVADRRVVRLIQQWLRVGVLEEGVRTRSAVGTVQGGSVSPLLANVYLLCLGAIRAVPRRLVRAVIAGTGAGVA